jgi:hypothetical protein
MNRPRLAAAAVAILLVAGSAGWSFYKEVVVGQAMGDAAEAFIATLNDEQRQTVVLAYDVPQRVDWHFIPKEERKGLQIRHMSEEQRKAAHALLQTALSQAGYDKATQIMHLENLLHEFEAGKGRFLRDPERYYFTIFGDPASSGRWGLSVEGHHLSLNFVVEEGEVISSTPQVFCTNPATVKNENSAGVKVGTRVLADEEQLAFDLVNSLSAEQKAAALFAETALQEVRDPGSPQPPQDPAIGLPAADMTADQQAVLQKLLDTYAGAMPATVAEARLAAIEQAGLDNVHFAWAGATEPGIGHYYRIQGPTFVVEFVNTQPDAAGNIANHIHTVWRDMRGDFGVPIE